MNATMEHRISSGALVLRDERILLVRHRLEGEYDYWAPPGGGVEDHEELEAAAAREVFEEAGIRAQMLSLAYIDELIDHYGRMIKFWYIAQYLSGEITLELNPAVEESIVDAGWFAHATLPKEHVFPVLLRDQFWKDLGSGFQHPRKLPLQHSIFQLKSGLAEE